MDGEGEQPRMVRRTVIRWQQQQQQKKGKEGKRGKIKSNGEKKGKGNGDREGEVEGVLCV